jgi:hypothetical protein
MIEAAFQPRFIPSGFFPPDLCHGFSLSPPLS